MMQALRLALLAGALLPVGAALAQTETPAPVNDQVATPIPTLHCDFKTMNSCTAGKPCVADEKVEGISLPLKVTVDFENSVVGAVTEEGYVHTDKFDTVAHSADQLIIHGIDAAFGWQLTINDNSEAASLNITSTSASLIYFGSCRNK